MFTVKPLEDPFFKIYKTGTRKLAEIEKNFVAYAVFCLLIYY